MPVAASTDGAEGEDAERHLQAVLHVDDLGGNRFLGLCPVQAFDRIYGGQLAAQSLLAAGRTVSEAMRPISTHVNFLRLGVARQAITYHVEELVDGRSLASRQVRAVQDDRLLCVSTTSFQDPATERGILDHDLAPLDPLAVPGPGSLPVRDRQLMELFGDRVTNTMLMPSWPIEIRYVDRSPWDAGRAEPVNRLWMKSLVPIPDDRLTQCSALVYAGDLHLPEPILFPQELPWYDLVNGRGVFGASLDYSVWFHRSFRVDEWLLHEQESWAIAGSRGLTLARWRSEDGQIVASASELVGIFHAGPA